MNQPYAVDRTRWANLSIFEQMGNVYSEVGRSFKSKLQHDQDGCERALIRALDLFDATIETTLASKPYRLKELLRAKDQFVHAIYDTPTDIAEIKSLEKYFMQFALAARLKSQQKTLSA